MLKREWVEIKRRPAYWGLKYIEQVSAIVITFAVMKLVSQLSV